MIAVPAIDLRAGACVQLVGGSFTDERIRIDNPLEVARGWKSAGFKRLHVVDLDAAADTGSNLDLIEAVLKQSSRAFALLGMPERTDLVRVSVGGGVRTTERVAQLIEAGADRVIVGTRAVEDPQWLSEIAERFAGRIVVALDVRARRVVTRAWATELGLDIGDAIRRVESLALAGVLVTAVHREGRMEGPDVALMQEVVRASRHPVIASGGIGSIDDLHAMASTGAAECVIGMALYTGTLVPRAVAKEFAE